MIDAPQQGRAGPQGIILRTVGRVLCGSLYVGPQCGLVDLGMVPPKPANYLTAPERLIELTDALLQH